MEYEENGTTWVLPESVSMEQLIMITLMPTTKRHHTLNTLAIKTKVRLGN